MRKCLFGVLVMGALLLPAACTDGASVGDPIPSSTTTNVADSTTMATTTSTSRPGAVLDLAGVAWVTHGLDGVRLSDGSLIWETRPFPADIARDRQGGLVFSDSTGLWWFRAGERRPERVGDGFEVLAVWTADDEVVAMTWADGPNAVRLRDGRALDSPPDAPVEVLDESPWLIWNAGNGMSAWVTDPQVERDSEGQPSRVIEPAHLVIADETGTIADVPVASPDRAWATIHDFDGQRLIVSRGPHEPAMPEESFLLVDLATGETTEILEAGATSVAFTGPDSEWAGPVRVPTPPG